MGKQEKTPYVKDFGELFNRTYDAYTDKLRYEYNDFYLANKGRYADMFNRVTDIDDTEFEEMDKEKLAQLAEKNSHAATDHFKSLFGSADFLESCFCGFRPAWDDLQKILESEFRKKTPPYDSAMNSIAPKLRAIASVYVFAEHMISELSTEFNVAPETIAEIKKGFEELLERAKEGDIEMPEYNVEKKSISKFKKADQYIDLCNKLFKIQPKGSR